MDFCRKVVRLGKASREQIYQSISVSLTVFQLHSNMKAAVTGAVLFDLTCCSSNTGPEVNTHGHVNKAVSREQGTANSTSVELDIITYKKQVPTTITLRHSHSTQLAVNYTMQ